MGSIGGGIPFPGDGAVELPDPGCIRDSGVDGAGAIVETLCKGSEAPLDEIPAGLIVCEVDPVEEVGTVPGVCPDRLREALVFEPPGDLFCFFQGLGVFLVG